MLLYIVQLQTLAKRYGGQRDMGISLATALSLYTHLGDICQLPVCLCEKKDEPPTETAIFVILSCMSYLTRSHGPAETPDVCVLV